MVPSCSGQITQYNNAAENQFLIRYIPIHHWRPPYIPSCAQAIPIFYFLGGLGCKEKTNFSKTFYSYGPRILDGTINKFLVLIL
jgi:hypothetical protein